MTADVFSGERSPRRPDDSECLGESRPFEFFRFNALTFHLSRRCIAQSADRYSVFSACRCDDSTLDDCRDENLTSYFLLSFDRHAQKRCRNGCLLLSFVLVIEQFFQLFLKLVRFALFLGGFERVHGGPIIFPEYIDELRWCTRKIESERVSRERDVLFRNSRRRKTLN